MPTITTRRQLLRGASALMGLGAASSFISIRPAAAGAPAKVAMQLGWLASNGNLGEAVAMQKGFFAEEGLDFSITPGGPNVDGVAGVASGQAALGQTSSSPAIMIARSAGIPVKAFAAGYQKHPFTYFSLAKEPIRKPADMIGKTIATQPTARILLRALLAENNIPEDKVTVVNMGSDMNQLMTGQAQAVTGWLTNTAALSVIGKDRVDMSLWDTGIHLYANVYFASDKTIAQHSDLLEAFLRAAARGWGYARDHQAEAVELLVKTFPMLDKAAEMQAVSEVIGFSFDDTTKAEGWGAMNADTWAAQIAAYAKLGQFKGPTPKLDEVMTLALLDATAQARKAVG